MTKARHEAGRWVTRALCSEYSSSLRQAKTQETEAEQRKRAGLGNGRGFAPRQRGINLAGQLVGCALHANGEPVPELVGAAAPGHRVKRARKANRAVRLGTTHVACVQLVLELGVSPFMSTT